MTRQQKLTQQQSHLMHNDSTKILNDERSTISYYYSVKLCVTITWFFLCVGAVMKRYNLIQIFYSFVACLLLATSFHIFIAKEQKHIQHSSKNHNYQSTQAADKSILIGTSIGVLMCIVQCTVMVAYGWLRIRYQQQWKSLIQISNSIAAGYIVFDQWYTFYIIPSFHVKDISSSTIGNIETPNQKNSTHFDTEVHSGNRDKSIVSVLEDSVTLIIILITLVHQYEQQQKGLDTIKTELGGINMDTYYVVMSVMWPIYKLTRLLLIAIRAGFPVLEDVRCAIKYSNHEQYNKSNEATNRMDEANKGHLSSSDKNQMIWKIYGIEYDLSSFVHAHPGGYEAIMLGCNRPDCTALFRSYHPSPYSYQHAMKVLQSCRRKNQSNQTLVLSNRPDSLTTDEFYDVLCARVTKELWDRHHFHIVKDRASSVPRVLYYWFTIAGVLISGYRYCMGNGSIFYGSVPFAIFGWLLGALGHDGGHFTVSRTHPMMNNVCVWAMSLLCNPIVWQHQHTYAHHSFTNDITHDPDLHHFTTLLRVHQQFQYYNIYQYQKHPLYVFFAYAFVVFGTCIWIPWGMINDGSLYGIVQWTDRHRPFRTLGMYLHLIVYTILIVIVPFLVHKHWYNALVAVTTHISLSGIIFAIFSQINHLNEESLNDHTDNKPTVYNSRVVTSTLLKNDDEGTRSALSSSWAVQQIESSNNFCPQSILWYYLSNGLNLQIEHHLFPGLNHCHLHKIQPIVQEVCNEYGIRYKCFDSWKDIMIATLKLLDRLSLASPKDKKMIN